MRDKAKIAVLPLALLTLLATPSTSVQAGPRDHIGGVFLRMSVGGGVASTEIKDVGGTPFDQMKISGSGADLNFAIGGMVAPNLALHGTLWGWFISNPDVTIDGQTVGTATADVSLNAFGGGVTYYIMPANVYLSGSIGAGSLSVESTSGGTTLTAESDLGLVVDATLGKEWWVGKKWGLGAAAGFSFHSIADGGVNQNWQGTSFALRFSVTYN